MLLASCGGAVAAGEADVVGDEARGVSGLQLPRYAALRTDKVNLRSGPGTRYPIEWVFVLKGLPVEITAEYDIWRRVRDSEGTEGWVNKTVLSGKRAAIITGEPRDMHRHDDAQTPVIAHVDVGAVGQLVSCAKDWCVVKFGGIKGYLRKTDFWGAYPNEVF